MKRRWLYGRALLALTLSTGLLVAGLSSDSSSAGASRARRNKIGLVTTLSGPIAPTFADAVAGAQARIGLQDAEGGVNGHQLQLITADDGGSPTTALTAIQSLASKGVAAIISQGLFFFAGAPYVNTQGIPVIGAAQDGTEWAQYKNMFGIFELRPGLSRRHLLGAVPEVPWWYKAGSSRVRPIADICGCG